eukprot:COSAG01_NODE_4913_length_4631_cov_6.907767_4_plen_44_part_01
MRPPLQNRLNQRVIRPAAAEIAKEKVSSLERELKTAGESEVQAQ